MCGIAGFITNEQGVNLDRWIESALKVQHSRGPDDRGLAKLTTSHSRVVFAHNRLAIIDLDSRSRQPMRSVDDRFVLTYNGEVYNYLELRGELECLGASFGTTSDTEVIIESWRRWGRRAVERLNGMFAFALFDRDADSVSIVRDRFGVKPLYWTHVQGGIAFASTAPVVASAIHAKPNLDYAISSLGHGFFLDGRPEAPFEKVQSLAAGCVMTVPLKTPCAHSTTAYYHLADRVNRLRHSLDSASDALERFRELLDDSIRLRLRADVRVGLSLSGGVDSSVLAGVAVGMSTSLTGFHFGSPRDRASEGAVVAATAGKLGLKVEWIDAEPSAFPALLVETIRRQGAPFSSPSIVAQGEVFRRANEVGVKVLLGGQGADEVLLGYRKFLARAAVHNLLRGKFAESFWDASAVAFAVASEARFGVSVSRSIRSLAGRSLKSRTFIMHARGRRISTDLSSLGAPLRWHAHDILDSSLPGLLRYEDRNSMGFGVETRLPYLDFHLVEFCLALPLAFKIRRGFGKYPLRLVGAGLIPDSVTWSRSKRGFDTPAAMIRGAQTNSELRELLYVGAELCRSHLIETSDKTVSRILGSDWQRRDVFTDAVVLLWAALSSDSG